MHEVRWVSGYGLNEKAKWGANIGVLQLPLFNLLGPEYKNCGSFSGIQGRRGLNTTYPKNSH